MTILNENTTALITLTKSNSDLAPLLDSLTINELVDVATELNASYRAGDLLISDHLYDTEIIARIAKIDPSHDYLNSVEPESADSEITGKVVTLSQAMLSTSKAYSKDVIEKWFSRILNAAEELNVPNDEIVIKATPKLDGFAILDDGKGLYTRGNAIRGTDVTRALERGLSTYNGVQNGLGPCELVVDPIYFEKYLSDQFDNTRNVISAVLKAAPYSPNIEQAVKDKAVVLAPFAALEAFHSMADAFLNEFESLLERAKSSVNFDIDGVVFEVINPEIKKHLGATNKAHRWMIAFKENEAPVQIKVNSITAQTSRNGVVVPVVELEPTEVSGVIVSRATAHNYKNIMTAKIGKDAVLDIVRSGLVIPKIVGVVSPVEPFTPAHCPSCGGELRWGTVEEGNECHLICDNTQACPAQAEKRLLHWFTTLGNVDGFGPATIRQILDQTNSTTIVDIYNMSQADFVAGGFGEKTASNLVDELQRSTNDAIEDYRFLAAFGINKLGNGNCEKLLKHYPLDELLNTTESDLVKIHKVGDIIAGYAVSGFNDIRESYNLLRAMNFNLLITTLERDAEVIESPIAGKTLVFTGTMITGKRKDLEKQAKELGAVIGKSVSGSTDMLIIGEKVGAAKTNAAEKFGTEIITEADYVTLIK